VRSQTEFGNEEANSVAHMGKSVRVVMLLALVFVSACRTKPPYDGKEAVELENMLRDPNPAVQAQGAFGLSRLGPAARSAVPSLIEALSKDRPVRQNAALALGQIGPDAREAVPALGEALSDSEWAVRRQAALALGQIGPEARKVIPGLQKVSRDPDPLVRQAAQKALKQIRAAVPQ
jgi:HEAT repeat protein